MRAALPFLLAAVLGVATAGLAACGSSGGDRSALIPPRSADRLKSALSDVHASVDSGNCDAAERAISRARGVLVNLPRAVDDKLVARLRQGLDNLQTIAPDECNGQTDTTPSQTTTAESTPTETTPTETTPTDTTPTDTTPTDTTPTGTTTTTPPTTTTTPPTTTTTPPPAGDTTGGTTTP